MKLFRFGRNKRTKPSSTTRREALPRGLRDLAAQAKPSANPGGFRGGDVSGLLFVMVLIFAVAAAALFRVWTRSETQRLGYAIVAAESKIRAAEVEHARLTVEEATLSSPTRIAKVAHERLGLHAPGPEQLVDIGDLTADDTELALASPGRIR